ncbi:CDKN2AIP N-terminal-like protein isoform X1 [Salvelinus namaycush]|uniref:CDKN2AIP N-terminal-like protein isoform X1 n=1 Tax=Salvelinus namaycush TaxID=8040 RepID=A0A8U0QLY3_SALNM|nr:CDKN2AIP N-terminal-like protein isoform X1 [Salvelinus namaycush]
MAEMEIEEFIEQNRHLATLVDTYRGISESEKHWKARREFLFRNINDFEDPHIDQLLALSMVWANNVFLGCRYSPDLLEKMKEMAEGIVVEDAPVFKTRDEIMKNQNLRSSAPMCFLKSMLVYGPGACSLSSKGNTAPCLPGMIQTSLLYY